MFRSPDQAPALADSTTSHRCGRQVPCEPDCKNQTDFTYCYVTHGTGIGGMQSSAISMSLSVHLPISKPYVLSTFYGAFSVSAPST